MEPDIEFSVAPFIIGAILLIGLIVLLIAGFRAVRRFFRRPELSGMSKEEIQKKWSKIEGLLSSREETSYKVAVMEADKLLDHALKSMGFGGNTLGERLKLAVYRYPSVRNVWRAHIVRNKLVHDADYHLSRGTAHNALQEFKRALKEFGIL